MKLFIISISSLLLLKFCGTTDKKTDVPKQTGSVIINKEKIDTITINEKAAVLYRPDTTQIDKRKKQVGEEDFYVGVDDYLFSMHTANDYLDSMKLKVFDVEGRKILRFIKKDNSQELIKLDTLPELWGVYLFEPEKRPKLVDMTSIDEEYKNYFGQ